LIFLSDIVSLKLTIILIWDSGLAKTAGIPRCWDCIRSYNSVLANAVCYRRHINYDALSHMDPRLVATSLLKGQLLMCSVSVHALCIKHANDW